MFLDSYVMGRLVFTEPVKTARIPGMRKDVSVFLDGGDMLATVVEDELCKYNSNTLPSQYIRYLKLGL